MQTFIIQNVSIQELQLHKNIIVRNNKSKVQDLQTIVRICGTNDLDKRSE